MVKNPVLYWEFEIRKINFEFWDQLHDSSVPYKAHSRTKREDIAPPGSERS